MKYNANSQAGDLARRIAHRRRELGLSVEELAQSAGIDSGYLRHLEAHSDARLTGSALSMVARALKVAPAVLRGGDRDRPLGRGQATLGAILEPLTRAQSLAYLECGGVGRVVFCSSRGPVALPVNYEFSNSEVIFSTTVAQAATLEVQDTVGFEIDRIDETVSEGWSVVVSGSARRVDDPDEILQHSARGLIPWAGGQRGALVSVSLQEVTGRSIVHDAVTGPSVDCSAGPRRAEAESCRRSK
jgi:transcriptional regulator with XRE-family HTH domain